MRGSEAWTTWWHGPRRTGPRVARRRRRQRRGIFPEAGEHGYECRAPWCGSFGSSRSRWRRLTTFPKGFACVASQSGRSLGVPGRTLGVRNASVSKSKQARGSSQPPHLTRAFAMRRAQLRWETFARLVKVQALSSWRAGGRRTTSSLEHRLVALAARELRRCVHVPAGRAAARSMASWWSPGARRKRGSRGARWRAKRTRARMPFDGKVR